MPSLTLAGRRWPWAGHLVAAILLVVGVLGLTYSYVSAEHALYTWDFHEYTTRLETTFAALKRSPLTAFVQVYLSTSQEYSLIPTIPMLPLRAVLGGSRLAFELNAAIVFIVPFVLAVGWVGSRTIRGPRGAVFWTTVLFAVATPYTWVAILRGFVDLGSAALVAMAIGLYVGDPRLGRPWRPIVIGGLLAAAILFRRPFAYDVVAFGVAIVLLTVGRAVISRRDGIRPTIRHLVADGLRLGLIAAGGLVVLIGIGHRFVGRVLIEDYGGLYQSYVRDAPDVLGWIGSGYGWLIIGLSVAGFVGLRRSGMLNERLLFVGIYGGVLTLLWAFVVGQEDVHYAAHFVLPVAVGLAAFAWSVWHAAPTRVARPLVAVLGALMLLNLAAGLSSVVPGNGTVARTLLAAANPPLIRADYDEMIRLARDIRRIAGTTEPVLVIGSTDGFSDDTVLIADEVSRGDAPPLFVLTSPHVDSRDEYPLRVMLAAQVVVLPDPLPLPLAADRQGIQRVMHDLFAQPSPTVGAFRPLPDAYVLEDGTRVSLFERTRPTTLREAVDALSIMREYTPEVPGGQVPWISVGGLSSPIRTASGDLRSVIDAGRDVDGRWVANAMIFIDADASTTIDGTAEFFDRTCAGVVLRLSSIDGTLPAGTVTEFRVSPAGPTTLQITGLDDGARDLLIQPEQANADLPCEARITLSNSAGDRADAKSLLIEDEGSGGP